MRRIRTIPLGRAAIRWLAACSAACAALAGCAGHPATPTIDARAAVGLTVFGPENDARRGGQVPARYLIEPDGWLRAAVGPGANEMTYPTKARWLTIEERERVAELLRACTTDAATAARGPGRFVPPAGKRAYLVEVSGAGGGDAYAVVEGAPGAAATAELADTLAAWCWVRP